MTFALVLVMLGAGALFIIGILVNHARWRDPSLPRISKPAIWGTSIFWLFLASASGCAAIIEM